MSSDQRGSEEPLKISFVVGPRQDPNLYAWLQNHPFKSTSAAIRALLGVGLAAMLAVEQSDVSAGEDSSSPLPPGRKPKPQSPSQRKKAEKPTPPVSHSPEKTLAPTQPTQEAAQPQPIQAASYQPFSQTTDAGNLINVGLSDPGTVTDSPDVDVSAALDVLAAFDRRF